MSSVDESRSGDPMKRDALLLVAAHVIYKLTSIAVLAIAGRVLDGGELGRYFFATSVAAPLLLLSHLGSGPLIARRVASGDERAFLPFVGLRAASAVVYFAALVLCALSMGGATAVFVLWIGLAGWMETSYGAFGALFIATARVRYNVAIGISAHAISFLSLAALLAVHPSLPSLVAADVLRSLVLVGLAAYLTHTRVVKLGFRWDPRVVREGLPFLCLAAGTQAAAHFTTVAVGWFGSYEEVAQYGLALRVVMATLFVSGNVGAIASRELARQGVTQRTRAHFARTSLVLLGGGAAGALLLPFIADDLCAILFGAEHRDAGPVLAWMGGLVAVSQWTTLATLALQAIGRERAVIIATCGGALVTLGTIPFAVPAHGAFGAVLAATLGVTTAAVLLAAEAARVGLLGASGARARSLGAAR